MSRSATTLSPAIALLAGLLGCLGPVPSQAEETVEECTQQELEARIQEARELGSDGIVRFACDGVITLTNTIVLTNSIVTDGDTNDVDEAEDLPERLLNDEITLDATGFGVTITGPTGTNATEGVRLFLVESGVTLTLINVRLANGQSTNGGAVFVHSNGALRAFSCVFSNNFALGFNGLDGNSVSANAPPASRGRAGGHATSATDACGGAVYNLGTNVFSECAFLTNSATGGNGGLGGNAGAGLSLGGTGGNGGRGGSALGGAIYNRGHIQITNCSFHLNGVAGGSGGSGGSGGDALIPGALGKGGTGGAASGGAIFNDRSSRAILVNSTFALNAVGGGDSAVAGGRGSRGRAAPQGPHGSGGALANLGTSLLLNCTFFGNSVVAGTGAEGGPGLSIGGRGGNGGVAWGGNVFNGGKKKQRGLLQAINCTFSDGSAIGGTNGIGGDAPVPGKDGARGVSRGGNIANSNGVFHLQNSLIAYPSAGTNAYGKFTDEYHNLASDRSIKFLKGGTSTNLSASAGTNGLKLGILARNGGPVETVELMDGSPAINRGTNVITLEKATIAKILGITNLSLSFDARSVVRPLGNTNDIGAYESGVVLGPPRIVGQPANRTAREGALVTFTVVAQGDPPLLYQWRRSTSDVDIDDATSPTLTIESVEDDDEGAYVVLVSNNSGSVTSDPATLDVVHPPVITEHPESMAVDLGANFILSVTSEGDEPLNYQWFKNGVAIGGAILRTFTVINATNRDQGSYSVKVCNPYGCETSDEALVTVLTNSPPYITTQPVNVVVASNATTIFSFTAGGAAPLSYYWHFNGAFRTSTTVARLSIPNARTSDQGAYFVIVSNLYGTATTTNFTLTVQTNVPSITDQPDDVDAIAGTAVTFSVAVAGSGPFNYQWAFNTNTVISGATNASFTITNAQATNVGFYRVIVANLLGRATSAPAALTVQASAPVIQTQPSNTNAFSGDRVTFSVTALGSDPRVYRWFFNSNLIAGATAATLTRNGVQLTNAGFYHVTVSNSFGVVASQPATLVVSNSPPIITEPPGQFLEVNVGDSITLSVTAVGSKPFAYQWYHYGLTNNVNGPISTNLLVNATNSTLSFFNIDSREAASIEGYYRVFITNSFGVTVNNPDFIELEGLVLINGAGVP